MRPLVDADARRPACISARLSTRAMRAGIIASIYRAQPASLAMGSLKPHEVSERNHKFCVLRQLSLSWCRRRGWAVGALDDALLPVLEAALLADRRLVLVGLARTAAPAPAILTAALARIAPLIDR